MIDSGNGPTKGAHGSRHYWILWVLSAVLLVWSGACLARGFLYLLIKQQNPVDLRMRWVEQRYVYNGQNPYDVVERVAALRGNQPVPDCIRDNSVDPDIGPPYFRQGGYPPWTFITVVPFVLPTTFQFTRFYFALLDALALTILFVWAYHVGRSHSRAGGVFLAAAALAVFGNSRTLQVGQYGILVNALLIGVYFLVEKRKHALAGIVYGMAALKPQITALYAFIFLVRRQWKSLIAATAYLTVASIGTWALTRTNPIEMLVQMQHLVHKWADNPFVPIQDAAPSQSGSLAQGCSSFLSLLMALHVDWKIATPLAAAIGLLSTGILLWLWRGSATLILFAIAATMGRLWSYHLPYDDLMLIFLLIALGKQVLTKPSPWVIVAFSLVGLSLWIPMPTWPFLAPVGVQIAQVISWLFGLAILLVSQPRSNRLEDDLIDSGSGGIVRNRRTLLWGILSPAR